MRDLIICLIVFVLSFLLRFSLYIVSKKNKNKKSKTLMMEMQYLVNRFKLNKKTIDNYKIACLLSFADAIIFSLSLFLTMRLSNNTVVEVLIAFVLVFGLIIIFNEIIGRFLKKRGYDKK